jgi:uncharacterized protein DUF3175
VATRRRTRVTRKRAGRSGGRTWIRRVQATSDALDLPQGIFTRSPRAMAQALKRAATKSRRKKARTDFQSAMSMLTYHVNRSGRALSRADRARFDAAKRELRRAFDRPVA